MASLMDELLLTMDGETEQYEKLIGLSDNDQLPDQCMISHVTSAW